MVTITNYNLSEITNHSNPILGLLEYTSQQTNYLPGIMLFFAIYIILFFALSMKGTNPLASFSVCNFVGFFLALLFFPLGILPGLYLIIMIILLAVSILILFMFS